MDDWTTGKLSRAKLSDEISFLQFKIQVPAAMRLDLNSSEQRPEGLAWDAPTVPGAHFSIYSKPRGDRKQRRPVVATFD